MKYLISILIVILSTPNLFAQNKCVELFSSLGIQSNQLAEEQILKKLEALVETAVAIKLNSFENPAQLKQAQEQFEKELSAIISINRKYLDVFRTMQNQKSDELITNANEKTRKQREEEKEKAEKVKDALDPVKTAIKIAFHDIKPGKFMMGDVGKQVETEITRPYALMATQMTQLQYAYIKILLGEKDLEKINPSEFKTGAESESVKIEGIYIEMKPNHPVEKVNWHEAKKMFESLSQLSRTGDNQTQKLIQRIIPGHQKGDIYDFPTQAQLEFVMRDRGNANKKYFDRDDAADISKYAWSDENAQGISHAVATLQPRMIDTNGDGIRHAFYDLEGNVSEWCKDFWTGSLVLPGGKDPLSTIGGGRFVRGGNMRNSAKALQSSYRNFFEPSYKGSNVGVRLVRTRP